MFPQVAKLQAVKVSRENADCVVANPHGVVSSPEKQPLQLAVAEQCLSAEMPG